MARDHAWGSARAAPQLLPGTPSRPKGTMASFVPFRGSCRPALSSKPPRRTPSPHNDGHLTFIPTPSAALAARERASGMNLGGRRTGPTQKTTLARRDKEESKNPALRDRRIEAEALQKATYFVPKSRQGASSATPATALLPVRSDTHTLGFRRGIGVS